MPAGYKQVMGRGVERHRVHPLRQRHRRDADELQRVIAGELGAGIICMFPREVQPLAGVVEDHGRYRGLAVGRERRECLAI